MHHHLLHLRYNIIRIECTIIFHRTISIRETVFRNFHFTIVSIDRNFDRDFTALFDQISKQILVFFAKIDFLVQFFTFDNQQTKTWIISCELNDAIRGPIQIFDDQCDLGQRWHT